MTGASTPRAQSTWQVHRWEHPDGRYFELASNVLSAEEIERRGLPPAAKDYKFHSSTPMVPEADLEQAWRNGWGSALNCLRGASDLVRDMQRKTLKPEDRRIERVLREMVGKWVDLIDGLTEDVLAKCRETGLAEAEGGSSDA